MGTPAHRPLIAAFPGPRAEGGARGEAARVFACVHAHPLLACARSRVCARLRLRVPATAPACTRFRPCARSPRTRCLRALARAFAPASACVPTPPERLRFALPRPQPAHPSLRARPASARLCPSPPACPRRPRRSRPSALCPLRTRLAFAASVRARSPRCAPASAPAPPLARRRGSTRRTRRPAADFPSAAGLVRAASAARSPSSRYACSAACWAAACSFAASAAATDPPS